MKSFRFFALPIISFLLWIPVIIYQKITSGTGLLWIPDFTIETIPNSINHLFWGTKISDITTEVPPAFIFSKEFLYFFPVILSSPYDYSYFRFLLENNVSIFQAEDSKDNFRLWKIIQNDKIIYHKKNIPKSSLLIQSLYNKRY